MAVTRGRVALVTGSSRGLGAVIARRLARDGLAVAVNGRPGDEQVAAVGRAIRDDGGTADGFYADVTDEDQVARLAATVTDRLGPVDVLVLNATGPQPEAAVTEVAWADHLAQLDFFVKSPVLLRHASVPGDVRKAYLASVPAGRMGTPDDIAHAVSFLASDGAGFITGQRILVDGGRSLGS
jgi:3-oxoacyl-[acyl-carrier protein] reductase